MLPQEIPPVWIGVPSALVRQNLTPPLPEAPDTVRIKLRLPGEPPRTILEIEELQRTVSRDARYIVQVLEVHIPRGPMVDTTVFRASDLSPLTHTSRGSAGELRLR